jgi:prepilin-type N-terminal cleavage/methylation domain-containing protein
MTPRHLPPASSAGFSLVEMMVAAVLMLISSIGGTMLFNTATSQAQAIRTTLQQQVSIANDLAIVHALNDRYSCAEGSCSAVLGGAPPNQNQYAPANPDDPSHNPSFRQHCTAGLADGLVAQINGTTSVAGPDVVRSASLEPALTTSTPPHRYRVRWSRGDGHLLRQVQLIPTVAGWCP